MENSFIDSENETICNFLSSLDMKMPMVEHFQNCMRDALLYKWNSSIVVQIMSGIEEAYKKKNTAAKI